MRDGAITARMRAPLTLLAVATVIANAACSGDSSSSSPSSGDDGGTGSGANAGKDGGGSSSNGTSESGSEAGKDAGSSASSSSGSSGSGSGSGSSSGSSSSGSGTSGSDGGSSSGGDGGSSGGGGGNHLNTVFIILMENNNWSSIYQSSSAPYINSLLPQSSYCTSYYDNPAAVHPSEPNYLWLEAATNSFADHSFTTDNDPSSSNSSSAEHLTKMMTAAGVTWKAYAENVTAGKCPVATSGLYAPKHVPMVFFTDVSGNPPSASNADCAQHVVPYTELATDLQNGTVAQYNFITPNLCDDMHGSTPTCSASISDGDTWLKQQIPMIQASSAYKDGGAIFITWDESEGGESPIGMIVLSPFAKGGGYTSNKMYYHSSMVRTVQEIFGLTPLLNDAANQPDLSDLFTTFP